MIRAALLALSLLNTHVVWTARLSAPVGTPAVSDGRIYVATGAKHTRLHALDATSGKRLWSAIAGSGTQYAPLAAPGFVLHLSNLDVVRRYDPATGRVFWRTNGPFAEGFLAQPLLASGRVLELSDRLTALDAATGAQLWTAPDDCFRCRVAATATRVFAAGKQGLRAFDAATGNVLWRTRGFASLDTVSSPTLAGNVLVVPSTSLSGNVWTFFLEGFRASDGRALWHTKLGATAGFDPWSAPVSSGRLVLYTTTNGDLFALDATTGGVRWRAHIGTTDSIPAVGNGAVWIVGGDNRLHALSPDTGVGLWSGPPIRVRSDLPTPSPVIDGNLVLLGTAAGNLVAYG